MATQKTKKEKFEDCSEYQGEYTPEELALLEELTDDEVKELCKLRKRERDKAAQAGAPDAASAWAPVIPYAVGPKAY